MKTFTLKGKTNHGKNRIRENDETWVLVDTASILSCNRVTGPFVFLKSIKTNDARWVAEENDKNFEVIAN